MLTIEELDLLRLLKLLIDKKDKFMGNKKLIFVVNNNGNGAVIEFPAGFEYPKRKTVKGEDYFITDRVRKTPNGDARIYTERNCSLDLEKYATGYATEEKVTTVTTQANTVGTSVKVVSELKTILKEQISFYKKNKLKQEAGKLDEDFLTDNIWEQFEKLSSAEVLRIIELLEK